ncbi:hypothetical protein KO504_12890 [Winogradskyella psychrotolerans]|uniref:hypothetical protein n=1 Tax=Winogradskyella psychrotolerans TaxID=1344585 RepID=UPI001C0762E4|nr:hypothetical protein [Winogradskyella psychrotolerans]MBU2922243.1 hypothetical protein [Winogradskyella psychrotolerans]
MKTKHILLMIFSLFMVVNVDAQILKKIRKKAEQAAERTILKKTDQVVSKKTEKTIDDATTTNKSKKRSRKNSEEQIESESTNSALELNTKYKTDFYKEDVVLKIHENGNSNQTQYFDAEEVAVRLESNKTPKPGYTDSEGFIYAYNDKAHAYNKSSLIASGGQGMMMPNMMLEMLKLPPEPFMANTQKQMDKNITPNPFNGFVEFAFIYKPEHFRYEDFKESKQSLRGKSYTKFEFLNEPGYDGSYVIFDDNDRLIEIYTNKSDTEQSMNAFDMDMMPPGESLIIYEYTPVEVNLPPAREVKPRGQDMMGLVMGSFKKDKNTEDIDEDDYDTSNSKGQVKSARNALKNNKVTAKMLPDSYDFDWQLETEILMASRKKEAIDMTFLIKENANYQATKMVDNKSKNKGNATMLFDSNLNIMVMFMETQGHNFFQMYPIPELKNTNDKPNFKITDLASKTILNYNCKGLQLEDDKYIIKMYHTIEAPIKLSHFMNFNGVKNMDLPDIDPKILSQFSNGLIMEMEMIDKKKSKNNISITAKSLDKKPTTISKKDYQSMNLLSGFKN